MDMGYRALLEKQGYHLVGEHSAVKLCHWVRQSLLRGRECYKQRFYGISTHRCIQMTPTLDQCTQMCTFCWREQGFTDPDYFGSPEVPNGAAGVFADMDDGTADVDDGDTDLDDGGAGVDDGAARVSDGSAGQTGAASRPRHPAAGADGEAAAVRMRGAARKVDDPEDIVEGSILAQRDLVSGFKGDDRCDPARWDESRNPNQVAISLSGEPTLYPHLSELIRLYKRKGMTVFLVTNGTRPDALSRLDELPSQLYVSVDAPDYETYRRICRPLGDPRARWDALMKTMDIFPSLGTRTVVRHTMVAGPEGNMGHPEAYAALDRRAEPDFIEPKGYVFVGSSRMRLNMGCMPSPEAVREFGTRIGDRLGYEVTDEMAASRVALLTPSGRDPLPPLRE